MAHLEVVSFAEESGQQIKDGHSHSDNLTPDSPRLLPEIWLIVFPYLDSSDLQSVSLVCSRFRYMAQPLLFSVLDISPFLLSYNEMPILRPQRYLERFSQRLEHYKLPHIAHGVRHCWISPYPRSGFPPRSHNDDLDPTLIIDKAVAALPHFPNLNALSWHCIDIIPKWWNIIQSLPITKLWINSSSVPTNDTSPLRTVYHLDLDQWPWEGKVTDHVSIHEERSLGISSAALRHITRPDVVQSISVPRSDTASNLLSILADQTHYLVSLKIPFLSLSDPNFAVALEHCPHLARLTIFPPSTDERLRDIRLNAFSPSALPSLARFEGPYTHVLKFCHQPLKRVSLWGLDDRPCLCNTDALTKTLAELAETESVNSLGHLELMVMAISTDLLDVLSSFRQLERITIQSQESSPPTLYQSNVNAPVTALYVMMGNTTLPPGIKHVKLSTRLSSRSLHHVAQEHEAAAFLESFARRHPSVQKIEIEYGIYWTGMYSVVWGRTRENNADLREGAAESPYPEPSPTPFADAGGGQSSRLSSKDNILSTVVSTVHPLPLGRLTFTEHRRKIFLPQDSTGAIGDPANLEPDEEGQQRVWYLIWGRLRRFFGRDIG